MNKDFVQRGGWWVVGQVLLLLAIAILGVFCHRPSWPMPLVICGKALFVLSTSCGLAGLRALGRNLTPFPKPVLAATFVQHGIYALIRHPLYTAVFGAAAGWSLVWRSWPALAVSLFLAVFLDAKARYEERWLRQKFPDYAGYERRVRRFIPWFY